MAPCSLGRGCHGVRRGRAQLLFAVYNGHWPRHHPECWRRVNMRPRGPSFSSLEAGRYLAGSGWTPSKKGQRASVGLGLCHGHKEQWLYSLCPPSILTAAAGSISGGRGEAQLPQRSYCSLCPPGYSAGEGRETGRLMTAVGPGCPTCPALSGTAGKRCFPCPHAWRTVAAAPCHS